MSYLTTTIPCKCHNSTGVDLAGLVGNYYFKVECSDVDFGVSDSVLIQIDYLGDPRVGILNTFAGDVGVRFRVFDAEGDSISYRYLIIIKMERYT